MLENANEGNCDGDVYGDVYGDAWLLRTDVRRVRADHHFAYLSWCSKSNQFPNDDTHP